MRYILIKLDLESMYCSSKISNSITYQICKLYCNCSKLRFRKLVKFLNVLIKLKEKNIFLITLVKLLYLRISVILIYEDKFIFLFVVNINQFWNVGDIIINNKSLGLYKNSILIITFTHVLLVLFVYIFRYENIKAVLSISL